jgi:RHS repeat-associated protein
VAAGQRLEGSVGLYDYNARYYSPLFGRFLSPDSIVPNPANPQDFNRYAYVRNNPLRYTDPSGHDPLDAAWEADFRRAHKRDPNDQDRRDRLFSVIHRGSGVNGSWTNADWARYGANRDAYWTGALRWDSESQTGIDSFATHIDRLSAWYRPGEESQFVMAVGLVWGGIPYTNQFAGAAAMANPGAVWAVNPPLHESNANWQADLIDAGERNQAHHWAGFFYMGFFYETWVGYAVNRLRDFDNTPDIIVGDVGVNHGRMLGAGIVNLSEVGDLIRQSFDARPAVWGLNSPGSRSLSVFHHIP